MSSEAIRPLPPRATRMNVTVMQQTTRAWPRAGVGVSTKRRLRVGRHHSPFFSFLSLSLSLSLSSKSTHPHAITSHKCIAKQTTFSSNRWTKVFLTERTSGVRGPQVDLNSTFVEGREGLEGREGCQGREAALFLDLSLGKRVVNGRKAYRRLDAAAWLSSFWPRWKEDKHSQA